MSKYVDGCIECDAAKALNQPPAVPHFNCINGGRKTGHSAAHCTADACW